MIFGISEGGTKMAENSNKVINRLPSKTWYWLGVNETRFPWDEKQCVRFPEIQEHTDADGEAKTYKYQIEGTDAFSERTFTFTAEKNSRLTVLMDIDTEGNSAFHINLNAKENGEIKLVQIQRNKADSKVYNEVCGNCDASASVELVQIYLGEGDIYSDGKIDLNGDGSSLKTDIGYLGQNKKCLDMNVVANHFGKNTKSEIQVAGALKDAAKKIFRGTIDFKKGSSGSTGDELETVLMLGDDVENKTIPLILCAEEDVAGNHGATIGELDEETLFYFESRGIKKEVAEDICARASIEKLLREVEDPKIKELALAELDQMSAGVKEEA